MVSINLDAGMNSVYDRPVGWYFGSNYQLLATTVLGLVYHLRRLLGGSRSRVIIQIEGETFEVHIW